MGIRQRVIEGKAGRYYDGKAESLTDAQTGQSQSKTYTIGAVKRKTVVLQGKEKKDDYIYKYNLKLHGGIASNIEENTSSTEWLEK